MKKKSILAILIVLLLAPAIVCAHTPLLTCWDNEDGTISCEGGFSDGSSAAGVEIRVEDPKGKVLIKDKLDKNGEFTFKKPKGKFVVVFDAGPGHVLKKQSDKIK